MLQPYSPDDTNINSGYVPVRTPAELVDEREQSLSIMGEGGYSNTKVGDAQRVATSGGANIAEGDLNAKQSAGMVGSPVFTVGYVPGGDASNFAPKDDGGNLNGSYDNTDRSAKFQGGSQDKPAMGANQYQN